MNPSDVRNIINKEIVKGLSLPKKPGDTTIDGAWFWDNSGGTIRGSFSFFSDTELFSVGADGASLADGIKLLTLPAGIYRPSFGRSYITIKDSDAAGAITSGEIGLGTTQASGAVSVLGGTAGFEDWMDGQSITAVPIGGRILQNLPGVADAGLVNSISGTLDVWLNMAAAFTNIAGPHKAVATKGSRVEIFLSAAGETPAKG